VDEWTSGQLDVLALIYGEFLHVWNGSQPIGRMVYTI
jgi:hypothetical protein